LDGEVVHASWHTAADLVDEDCGVVAEEGVGATGEFEEVNQVGIGPLWLHSGHGVSKRDALVKGGERPELDPSPGLQTRRHNS
jgi:hypothetical protein